MASAAFLPERQRLTTQSDISFFRTLADLQSALAATAADFIADERNYTDVPSVVQISEVVEMPC